MNRLSPTERLARYGPTTGDEIRLGDTDLWIRVGEDRQAPGDEPIWGYAKTIRPHSTQGRPSPSELDAVESAGRAAVAPDDVIDGVRELVDEVRLEVLVDDGTRLVVLADPLGRGRPMPPRGPGAIVPGPAAAVGAGDLERRSLVVRNTSRRVVRVSSHMPFDRVNARLEFDRPSAAGFRLDLPAGASERWAPGEERTIELVRLGGSASLGVKGGADR